MVKVLLIFFMGLRFNVEARQKSLPDFEDKVPLLFNEHIQMEVLFLSKTGTKKKWKNSQFSREQQTRDVRRNALNQNEDNYLSSPYMPDLKDSYSLFLIVL